jgi:hypothetical protein
MMEGRSMKRFLLLGGCVTLAITLAACESRSEYRAHKAEREALKVLAKLDCPETQGQLTLTSKAADGLSCIYSGANSSEVTLRLVAVSDEPAKALEPIETELRGLFPAPPATPKTPAVPGEPDAKVTRESVKLPGLTVETEEGGDTDKAHVRMPGFSVNSEGDKTSITIAGMQINADDSANEVHITRERWRDGDDGDINIDTSGDEVSINSDGVSIGGRRKAGFRSTFVKSDDTPGTAYSAVGYEARGPRSGPLVVAVIKIKSGKGPKGDTDSLFKDAGVLIKHNVGG